MAAVKLFDHAQVLAQVAEKSLTKIKATGSFFGGGVSGFLMRRMQGWMLDRAPRRLDQPGPRRPDP